MQSERFFLNGKNDKLGFDFYCLAEHRSFFFVFSLALIGAKEDAEMRCSQSESVTSSKWD